MAHVWSIVINGDEPAQFNADVYGTNPGAPLKAQVGDLVSWNNQTSGQHQIQVGTFTTDLIEMGASSKPGYVVVAPTAGSTIDYICTRHARESGKILVVTS